MDDGILVEYFFREQRRLPSQVEVRRALERRINDWFMVMQPSNQSFPATHQIHTRGIWTDDTRQQLLDRVRRDRRLDTRERTAVLEKLWKDEDMAWLRGKLDALTTAVRRAQDRREPVTPEVNKRVESKFPGVRTMLRLFDDDRIVNRANAHTELRSLSPSGDVLIGWTLDTPGVMLQFLKSGRLVQVGRNKLTEFGTRVSIPGRDQIVVDRIQVQKKSPQPLAWLSLVTKKDPNFEAEIGQVGATAATAGRFEFITGGGQRFTRVGSGRSGFSVVYGTRRSNFHEQFHFYEDPELQERIGGRWTFRLLSLGGREGVPEALRWLARRVDDARPFIFRNDFEAEVAQARKEKTNLFWNFNAVAALERMGYFRQQGLTRQLAEWKKSDRGKPPPRKGVVRFRPRGRLANVPEIFSESVI